MGRKYSANGRNGLVRFVPMSLVVWAVLLPLMVLGIEDPQQQLKRTIRDVERGDSATALPVLENLLQQFRTAGDLPHEGETLVTLADAYARQGEIFVPMAVARYGEAVTVFQKAATPGTTRGLNAEAAMRFKAQVTLAKLGDLHLKLGK